MSSPSLLDFLRDLPDADLVRDWHDLENEARDLLWTRDAHRGEVLRRITESGMIGLETESGAATKEPTYGTYEWDQDELAAVVLSRLLPAQREECLVYVPSTAKVNTAAVKKYARKLGISEDELEQCYSRPELTPKLSYHEPVNLLEQLEASVSAMRGNG